MQWHDVNTTPNTLLLTGSPGSGKSSICQVTRFFLKAWHQSEIEICVAYLALDSFQKEELTVSEALSNIVQQMMLERPYLMDHVNTLKFTGGQLSRAESIDVICRSRHDLKQFYLILDGLDECENMGRELFEDLLTIEPPLKILVATRPNRGIMMTFRNCVIINLNMPMSLSGHLEYVITLLEKDPRIFGYLDHNHDNVANAAKIITDKSNGINIHTNAIVNSLAQAETRAAFELLLYDPPSCLHDMYKLMLDNVLQQPAEFTAFAKKTLRVMLQASSPVSISHLAKASKKELESISYKLHLGRDPTEGEIFEACVSSCKGFVSAASSTDVGMRLQLFHFSGKEFLQVNGLPE
ncbi:hypothetical protein N7471_011191 [Penicillium samsonianum]|uniref:uncharacterized protein n=1 Tax=Penicillium samsonianum TaxID=1882272 RepID=UPI00254745BF|nr:uncharacterized protein N7471_011191 [Penicillium samsonianum]KAJ6123874.1 hypothetical protein N7471_011191 [Penicillium samsonianum]